MNELIRVGRWQKLVVVASVLIMLFAAVAGLVYALLDREFGPRSLGALTTGLGALLIVIGVLVTERMSRKFHPESALFLWTDVDQLRNVARSATDDETRAWALSLSERIAVVLPKRTK
jgi:hypothetical protein